MFAHFGLKDFIDVVLVALLLFYLFRLVKISGMRPLFVGILVFMLIWILVSRVFNMVLLGSILDQFVSVGLFLLVILFQDDHVGIRVDFECILLADIQRPPQLDRKNDASQLINFSNDAGRFHSTVPPDQYDCCLITALF